MRAGLVVSVFGHLAALGMLVFAGANPFVTSSGEAITVELVPDNETAAVTDNSAPGNAIAGGIAATAILRSFSAIRAGPRCRLQVAACAFVLSPAILSPAILSPAILSPAILSLAAFSITAAHSTCIASIDRAERRDAATRTRPDGLPVIGATPWVHGRRIGGGRGALGDAATLAPS